MQLSNCCTDQLLAVIGTNCKSLEVLDAEEDSEMMTTDHGLSFLTNCVKLTTIILNDAGDEYDYEDRYFGITGTYISYLEFIKGGFISEKFFTLALIKRKVPNHSSEHYPTKVRMLRGVIWHFFGRLEPK